MQYLWVPMLGDGKTFATTLRPNVPDKVAWRYVATPPKNIIFAAISTADGIAVPSAMEISGVPLAEQTIWKSAIVDAVACRAITLAQAVGISSGLGLALD